MAMKFAGAAAQADAKAAGGADPFFAEAASGASKWMVERFCTERKFISANAAARGFAGKVEAMIRSPEFADMLRNVAKVARECGKSPQRPIGEADRRLLLNFRVNFNAMLNDGALRGVLVRCAQEPGNSRLKELIRPFISDPVARAGLDRVTYLMAPGEKFRRTVRALWELQSLL